MSKFERATEESMISQSFYGHEVLASVNELNKATGIEPCEIGSFEDKAQYEWILKVGDLPFAIHDWREHKGFSYDAMTTWRIRAQNMFRSGNAMDIIESALYKLRND